MARIRTYAETASLGDEALRDLASHGAAEERALACWRFMTRGQALTIAAGGPDDGTRQLLLLNFAVAGEVELLRAVAMCDPASGPRRDALSWLWRVAPAVGLEVSVAWLAGAADDSLVTEAIEVLPWSTWAPLAPALVRRLHPADDALRGRVLARWASGEGHTTLLATLHSAPKLADAGLRALLAAGRRYEFEVLAPLVADEGLLLSLLGPRLSPAARGWLLEVVQAALRAGRDPGPALVRLAQAHAAVPPSGLPRDAIALLQVLGAPVVVDWSLLRDELVALLTAPAEALRSGAAFVLVGLAGDVTPPEVRWHALDRADAALLAAWAHAADHGDLLTAAAEPDTPQYLRHAALAALYAAERVYPASAVAPICEAIERSFRVCVEGDAFDLTATVRDLMEGPLPPEAEAWFERMQDEYGGCGG